MSGFNVNREAGAHSVAGVSRVCECQVVGAELLELDEDGLPQPPTQARLSGLASALGEGEGLADRTFASCHDPRAARQRPCQACRASGRPTTGPTSDRVASRPRCGDSAAFRRLKRVAEARAGPRQAKPQVAKCPLLSPDSEVPCHPFSRERVDRRPHRRSAASAEPS